MGGNLLVMLKNIGEGQNRLCRIGGFSGGQPNRKQGDTDEGGEMKAWMILGIICWMGISFCGCSGTDNTTRDKCLEYITLKVGDTEYTIPINRGQVFTFHSVEPFNSFKVEIPEQSLPPSTKSALVVDENEGKSGS